MIFLLSTNSKEKYHNGHPLVEQLGFVEAEDARKVSEQLDMEITNIMFRSEGENYPGVFVDLTDKSGRVFFLESIKEIKNSLDLRLLL